MSVGTEVPGRRRGLGEADAQARDISGVVRPHGVVDLVQLLGRVVKGRITDLSGSVRGVSR